MKNLIIQSQYQKDSLKKYLIDEIDKIEFDLISYSKYYFDTKTLIKIIDKKLELKNLLDQLNRMGDFI